MACIVPSIAFSHLSISSSSSTLRLPSPCSSSPLSRSTSLASSALSGTSLRGKAFIPVFPISRPSVFRVFADTTKKVDSAVKRARQAEKRHIYNKSRKSEIKTRMKKVFLALDVLKTRGDASSEDIKPIEALIGEAYSVIDKAVKVGTLHRNTGNHRKSRIARAKQSVEMQLGWYTPVAPLG